MPHRLVVAGYVGLVLAGAWALNHASEQRSLARLRSSETTCLEIGNPGRALDRLSADGHLGVLRQDFQPIVDCHATYFEQGGRPVPLTANQQAAYVRWISQGIRPVIRADGTVAPK